MKIILIGILAISAGTCIAIGAEKPAEFFNETQKTTTLFSFDDVSIPFTENLKLEMRTPERHSDNPVVNRGPEGSVDSWAVQFYGSVLRDHETGKFRMWYAAVSKEERKAASKEKESSRPWRVAYAESDDGVNWTKPKLGLVEALGNKDNNLCLLEPHLGVLNLKVLDEPNDPNPAHRFKLGAHVWTPKSETRRNGTLAPYVSADGYTWKLLGDAEPVKSELPEADTYIPPLHFEPVGGLYKWDGLYHLSGQNAISATVPYHGRVSRTFISPDFKNWSQGSAIQAVRAHQHELLGPGKSRIGEQTHEGISVWNRGNVLVGVSGIWHGTPEWKGCISNPSEASTNGMGSITSRGKMRFLRRSPITGGSHEPSSHLISKTGARGALSRRFVRISTSYSGLGKVESENKRTKESVSGIAGMF